MILKRISLLLIVFVIIISCTPAQEALNKAAREIRGDVNKPQTVSSVYHVKDYYND